MEGKKYGGADSNERSLNEEGFASDRNKNCSTGPDLDDWHEAMVRR